MHLGNGVAVINDLGGDFTADCDAFAIDSVAAFVAAFVTAFVAAFYVDGANSCKMAFLPTFVTCLVLCYAAVRALAASQPTLRTLLGLVSRFVLSKLAPRLVTRLCFLFFFLALFVA